jgi:hypothetical protein
MFYLGFEIFRRDVGNFRRDLLDEGVVRKARIERKPVLRMGCKAGK